MRKFFKGLSLGLALCSCVLLAAGCLLSAGLPSDYKVTSQSGLEIHNPVPVSVQTENGKELVEAGVLNTPNKTYDANLKLLNIIPLKEVKVQVVEETKVIPCGTPFGVKIFTDGVVVVGIADVKVDNATANPSRQAGLKTGDVILQINGQNVNSNEEVSKCIQNCNGESLMLCVRRENMTFTTELKPVKSSADNHFKAGLWVRDSSAGIGTLTFYNEEQQMFAGLGHGICDVDTGELMPLRDGDIVTATINGVVRGVKGTPGELRGYFNDQRAVGGLLANVNTGVYGTMGTAPIQNEAVVVAMKQQVKTGKAQILTTIDGQTPQYYDIEIESVNYKEHTPTKNMVIRITDPKLLETTGGIVQGMSGSPIIQNGMLVGAVTHVFVNEPERGYGIFAENMVSVSSSIFQDLKKKAS
ncbi:MAG: SpoIVB peptidase [Clostridiales bacterium]|jgi:stage IV sporulation protein B|nr:SpoIVB peptidase [Clostridiales bacterium]